MVLLESKDQEMADIYSALIGQIYLYTDRLNEAEPFYRRAVAALRKRKDGAGGLARYLYELSHILEQRGSYDEADRLGLEARSLLVEEKTPRFELIALNLNTLGRISDFRRNHQKAREYFLDELAIIEIHLPNHSQYKEAIFNISESFRMEGNLTSSNTWCEKAAELGLPAAQFIMGQRLFNGDGTTRDYGAAANWFRKAANAGFSDAQNDLGLMYSQGLGVPQSDTEAVKLYQMAANGGNNAVRMNLAKKLVSGEGTQIDLVQAYYILTLVAVSGRQGNELTEAMTLRSEIAAKMTREQLSSAMALVQKTSAQSPEQ